jgi:O-antigen ligase
MVNNFTSLPLSPGFERYTLSDVFDITNHFFFKDHLWLLLLIFSLLWVAPKRPTLLGEGLWAYLVCGLRLSLGAMFIAGLTSAFCSHLPEESMVDFRNDLGTNVLLALLVIDMVRTPREVQLFLKLAVFAGIYVVLVNFLALFLFKTGADNLRNYLVQEEILYCPDWYNHRSWMPVAEMDVRPSFPLRHHNRVANYMMLLIFCASVLVVWPGSSLKRRFGWLVAVALLFALLIITKNRGTFLALMAAVFATAALFYRPMQGWKHNVAAAVVVIMGMGGWLAMPMQQKQRLVELFVWSDNPNHMDGNLLRRWHSIKTANEMYARHKWVGIGYGYHVFEELYQKYEPKRKFVEHQPEEMVQPHAHMNWVQVAAEGGRLLLYSYCLHVLLTFVILLLGIRAARRAAHPLVPALIVLLALNIAIFLFGFTNYSLRYSTGMLYFFLLTLSSVAALSWHRLDIPDENTAPSA